MRWIIVLFMLAVAMAVVLVRIDAPIGDPLWWATNETPPRLSVSGPAGPLRGAVEGAVSVEPAGRTHIVSIAIDGQAQSIRDQRVAIDTASLPDGQHTVEVVARDTSRHSNQASAVWSFVSDNTPPTIDATLDPSEGPQEGHTVVIHLKPSKPTQHVEGTFADHPLRLQSDGNGGFWAVEGITPGTSVQSAQVHLSAADALGNAGAWQREATVRATQFPEDDLVLEPSAEEMNGRAEEDRLLGDIYQRADGAKRWDGKFRVPLDGPVTTQFGTHRSYEYHPGMDIAAPMGAEITAPASGVVAFEGKTLARGMVLILNHGAGVYTTYAHLRNFEVEPGAEVKPGDLIARVGTSGFSTGPHLHWEMWVDNANVDPADWIHRAFP